MPIIRETLDKGLVTARDPALLREGEVQRAINCIYRPGSPSLWKAPGRTTYNSSPLSAAVKGLRHLVFDGKSGGVTSVLVAHISSEYQASTFPGTPGTEVGTFASLAASVGSGASLEAIHMFNRHYLLNGNAEGINNQVAKLDKDTGALTSRGHGLAEVVEPVTVALLSGAGWPTGADFGDGYYFFFYTEVVNPGDIDEIESAVASSQTPAVFVINGTTDGVTVTFPSTTANSTATHRRLYMVGPKSSTAWSSFYLVEARQIAQVDIGTTTIGLGGLQASTETKLPGATTGSSDWTNPNNILAKDGAFATRDADNAANALIARDFTWTTGSMTAVKGFRVRLAYKLPTDFNPTIAVEISVDAGASWSQKKYSTLDAGAAYWAHRGFTVSSFLGGSSDLWGRIIAAPATQLSNGNFRVRITSSGLAGDTTTRVSIDFVEVTVYYGSTNADVITKGAFYPTTSVRVGPTVTVVSANSPPPIASTGDVYEGQLVLNDVSDPSIIRYSIVDKPDAFPSIYFINFETRYADQIKVIRKVNNILVVGMTQQIYRVNHLPVAEDISFERLFEPIAEDHGMVSLQAVATFTPPGAAQQLAYASAVGLHFTDGIHTDTLTEDLDWANTVNVSQLGKSILVNDPHLTSLIFYYIPAGDNSSTYPTRALYLSYDSTKIKEGGKLTVSGPVTVDAASSCIGTISNLPIHLTGASTGTVSVEDRGAGSAEMDVVTRDSYPAGFGDSTRFRKFWLRVATDDPGVEMNVQPYVKNADADYYSPADSDDWIAKVFRNNKVDRIPGDTLTPNNKGMLTKIGGDFAAESFALRIFSERISGQANGRAAITAFGFDAENVGENKR